MADSKITLVGNIVTEPELRFSAQGMPTCTFRFVQSDRVKNKQTNQYEDRKPELFLRVTLFGNEGENVVESDYKPGTRVMMTGTLRQESEWTDKEGNTRPGNIEFIADEVAASNKFAKVTVERTAGGSRQARQQSAPASAPAQQQAAPATSDPWGGSQQAAPAQAAPSQVASDPWATGATVADPWANK